MRTVVFDLDGTLADTAADLIAAANACFRGLGLPDLLDPVADAATALQGVRQMLRLGFSRMPGTGDEQTIEEQYPVFLDHYSGRIAEETRLYPGAREAVDALRGGGWRVAICTNKPTYLAEALLDELGVADAFDAVIGAGSVETIKPDPAPYLASVARAGGAVDRSFLVGDSITDHRTARAVGVPSVLVTFAPALEDVRTYGADALISELAELPALAERLIAP